MPTTPELLDPDQIFAIEIEQIMERNDLSLIDAAIHWCEQRGLEVEYASSMIKKNKRMKAKIQEEGLALRMIKKPAKRRKRATA